MYEKCTTSNTVNSTAMENKIKPAEIVDCFIL